MLVSPTEPEPLRRLGTVHDLCEQLGSDFLIWDHSEGGWMGVQRKEMKDFVASTGDGRLAEQITKMKQTNSPTMVIEGRPQWNRDGKWSSGYASFTWSGFQRLLLGIQRNGVRVAYTDRMVGSVSTAEWLVDIEDWMRKSEHGSLKNTRGPVPKEWGKANNRDYQRHLLLGFEGMGPKMADQILDQYGMPLTWKEDALDEMLAIKGIGPGRIAKWSRALT